MAQNSKKNRYDFDFDDTRPKLFRGIDSIRIRRKKPVVVPLEKSKKIKKNWSWLFLLLFLPIIGVATFFGLQQAHGKIDFLKFFEKGKYIVLFQNNSEMRPTGGFIGSFAIIEFENYKIKNLNFNTNILKLDNAFKADHVIAPPKPLERIDNGQWSLCDANFAVDFPESAQKVEWFYEQETGEKVDGVVAINATLIRDLLKIVGPINLPDYKTTISADNFFTELAQKIEKDYFENPDNKVVNEPKSILKDMFPQVISRTFSLSKIQLGKLAYEALKNKEVLFYSNNTGIQNAILAENWGGQVRQFDGDYLYINNANIADLKLNHDIGGKSSLNVKENIDYKVDNSDGLMMANLNLTRSHVGSYKWPDGINHNWTKVLVPEGVILKKAELNGKDIMDQVEQGEEAGKAYFATWIDTAPSTSSILNLSYSLPLTDRNYQILVQKQPGNPGDNLQVSFQNKVLFDNVLNEDKVIK